MTSLEKALAKDKEHLGKRYLEVERSDDKTLKKFTENAANNSSSCFRPFLFIITRSFYFFGGV